VLTGECCNETRTSIVWLIFLLFYLHMSFYLSQLRIARGTAHRIYVGLQWVSLFGMLLTLSVKPLILLCIYWMLNDIIPISLVCVLYHWRRVHVSIIKFVILVLRW
jgi:hypothetical protein